MTIVGFNFSKIHLERKGDISGELKISNNVRLVDVSEIPLPLAGKEQKGLRMKFEYSSSYEPDVGDLVFEGEIVEVLTDEEHKTALTAWQKDKAVDKDLMKRFINAVFRRCLIQAIVFGREVSLPPPVRLPVLKEDTDMEKSK